MTLDSIEGEFVARATAAQSRLGPAADLDTGVGADDSVALFSKGIVSGRVLANHLLGLDVGGRRSALLWPRKWQR